VFYCVGYIRDQLTVHLHLYHRSVAGTVAAPPPKRAVAAGEPATAASIASTVIGEYTITTVIHRVR
jgi:hypothetical protein